MDTQTKLIYQALLLVGAPIATHIISSINFGKTPNDLALLIYSPLAMVFFGVLFAIYFIKFKAGKLTKIRLFLKAGVYLSIILFILMIVVNIYNGWTSPYIDYKFAESQTVDNNIGYRLRQYPRDFLPENYNLLILIALMFVSLRLNKSIESSESHH